MQSGSPNLRKGKKDAQELFIPSRDRDTRRKSFLKITAARTHHRGRLWKIQPRPATTSASASAGVLFPKAPSQEVGPYNSV